MNINIYRGEVVKRIEAITKHSIGNRIIVFPNGVNKTIEFYDITLSKYKRCTLKKGCIISNVRDIKERKFE